MILKRIKINKKLIFILHLYLGNSEWEVSVLFMMIHLITSAESFNLKACSPEDRSFHPQISTHTQQHSWSQGGPASDWNSLCLLLQRWVPYIVFRVIWTVKNESLQWIREYVLVVIETYFIALKLNLAHFLVWYILYNSIFGGRAVIS